MYFDEPVQTATIERSSGVSLLLALNGLAVLGFGLLPGGLLGLCKDAIIKALTT